MTVQQRAPLRPSAAAPVRLSVLLPGAAVGAGGIGSDARVGGITADSRLVAPGDLYVALPGQSHHGAEFAATAVAAGAAAVLTDQAGASRLTALDRPVLIHPRPREALAGLAARIYGEPANALTMYAVTGTNGKTTTSYLLDAALRAAGQHVGVVGTIGYLLDGVELAAVRTTVTTPEAPELQALLGHLRDRGADAVVMEVSSHALVLGRVDAIRFDVAGFTNFGRDHLDFHGDVESYFEAKASLFTPGRTRRAVINIDDPRGEVLLARLRAAGEVEVATVSLSESRADYRVDSIRPTTDGRLQIAAVLAGRPLEFLLGLPGDFNVRNALTALAMAELTGVDVAAAAPGLATAAVPGRMQRVDLGERAPTVYVDFAHTPQAVAAALAAIPARRRIVVLGGGGDRDPDKRAPMGAAAAIGADVVIVTDDNPRTEDPATIRSQLLSGAALAQRSGARAAELHDGGDRRSAIRLALRAARPGDAIAVLGKGHERGQEVNGTVLPFDDAAVVAEEWAGVAGR